MEAAVLYGDREIRVGAVPEPVLGRGDVIVASEYAGICGTDLHVYRGEFRSRVRYPAILGHEFGGEIVEVGPEVRGFRAGDRVAVDPILSCHACPACLTGHVNACLGLKLLGIDVPGGFGRLVAVPAHRLFRLPDNVPMKHAPMVEMFALGHHILERGRVQPGETVVLLGAGKLGLSILDVLCHSASPGLSIVTDLQPFRLETARALGADRAIDVAREDPVSCVLDLTEGVGADCVIEAVGHYHGEEAPLSQAVKMVRNGGRIVTAGLGEQLSSVHFKTLVLKEAEIIASRVTRGEFPRALRLMSRGLLHAERLITAERRLVEVTDAFAQVDREDPATIKVVLHTAAA
jgi:2-desacetyl-2-hydroxyethyl bacteriochlorophyllide A dehydrogenase